MSAPDRRPRYAVYYAPSRETALWRFGSAVLGYDSDTGEDVAQGEAPKIARLDWRATTAEPRRYGFHATLKAPFHLADGATENNLRDAVAELASRMSPTSLGALQPRALGSFVALASDAPRARLGDFAQRIVAALEPLRAPLSPADLARRLESPLTPRQQALLAEFGYPYVMEEYRFHMTLTGPLHFDFRPRVEAALRASYAARVGSSETLMDQLAICRQDRRDAPFRIIRREVLREP